MSTPYYPIAKISNKIKLDKEKITVKLFELLIVDYNQLH